MRFAAQWSRTAQPLALLLNDLESSTHKDKPLYLRCVYDQGGILPWVGRDYIDSLATTTQSHHGSCHRRESN